MVINWHGRRISGSTRPSLGRPEGAPACRPARSCSDFDCDALPVRVINRLRWHLHELDPASEPAARSLWRPKNLTAIIDRLTGLGGLVARLARIQVERCRELTGQIREVDRELEPLVAQLAPTLVELCGCATLTAAKIIGEAAG